MLEIKELSRKGNRKNNEDYTGMLQKDGLWCLALADGVGGFRKGELAAVTAINAVMEYFQETGEFSPECMAGCFESAQQQILKKQKELSLNDGMRTTMVILFTNDEKVIWGYIGDSRVYRIREDDSITHTKDHSVAQMLVTMGVITEDQIRENEDRNKIFRSLGMEWETPAYIISEVVTFEASDSFLLCSDGFWEGVLEEEIVSTRRESTDVTKWLDKMEECIKRRKKRQDMDNYSGIALIKRR